MFAKVSEKRSSWVAFMLPFVLFFFGLYAFAGEEPEDQNRVDVRIEVRDAKGEMARVLLTLAQKGGKEVKTVESNGYGLAFTSLLAGESYRVSQGKFKEFAAIRVPLRAPSGYRVELQLPDERMGGKTASEGRGLVIFTYVDAQGRPKSGAELQCADGNGRVFRGITDARGIARVEVPLGAVYAFSVEGYPNFETHTFNAKPSLQTTEIRLEETAGSTRGLAQRSPRPPIATPSYSVYESAMQKSAPPMRNRRDSVTRAKQVVRQAVRQGQRVQYATPRRGVKPSPKVTKQVMNGVYLLRQALIEEEKENLKAVWSRMPVLSPLTRNSWDSVVLVVDVTCSMDPYVEEYLLWTTLARNERRLLGCVFFNDGDGRADSTKVLGAAGGVRHASPTLREMVDTLVKCVS